MTKTYYRSTIIEKKPVFKKVKSVEERCKENALRQIPEKERRKKFMYDEKREEIYDPFNNV